MQKIFRANYSIVHDIISSVFIDGRYSNKQIEKEFKYNKKLGARDRKFIAENVYDIVRWWKRLLYCCDFDQENIEDRHIKELINTWLVVKDHQLPEFIKADLSKLSKNKKKWNSEELTFSARYSFSDDISEMIQNEFKESSRFVAKELNKKAPIYLRVNLKNIKKDQLLVELNKEGIEAEEDKDVLCCLKLNERANVFRTESFKKGYFEVQDKGSQTIARFLQVEPGQLVIDACAGAGGKSLHIADIMANKGRIICLDIHQWKLDELKRRARRNSISIIDSRIITSTKVIKRIHAKADRVLLDVPCSGFGVIKRNPDSKWKFSKDYFNSLLDLQADILQKYAKMTKVGGKMVYSTCSIFSAENDQQVKKFLNNNKDWALEDERLILPTEMNSDGFYMARLIRKA